MRPVTLPPEWEEAINEILQLAEEINQLNEKP